MPLHFAECCSRLLCAMSQQCRCTDMDGNKIYVHASHQVFSILTYALCMQGHALTMVIMSHTIATGGRKLSALDLVIEAGKKSHAVLSGQLQTKSANLCRANSEIFVLKKTLQEQAAKMAVDSEVGRCLTCHAKLVCSSCPTGVEHNSVHDCNTTRYSTCASLQSMSWGHTSTC